MPKWTTESQEKERSNEKQMKTKDVHKIAYMAKQFIRDDDHRSSTWAIFSLAENKSRFRIQISFKFDVIFDAIAEPSSS